MANAHDGMKVTTIRIGRDLWALLEHEAALLGVSASQYIREAALARASAVGAARGDAPFELLAGTSGESSVRSARARHASADRDKATETRAQARALRSESKQARRMAEQTRARTKAALEAQRREHPT